MFERLMEQAERRARGRADERRATLLAAMHEELPMGVKAEEADDGVVLSGRGLGRRFAFDPELRWLMARLK